MVDRIGSGSHLQREALLAALKSQAAARDDVREAASRVTAAPSDAVQGLPSGERESIDSSFSNTLKDGLRAVDGEMRGAGALPRGIVSGQIDDLHEVAVQLKRADLSFRFALEIRNKLIDAYREVMRMNV